MIRIGLQESMEELGPYPDVANVGLLRDKLVCDPCKGPMVWIGETEQWACPSCPNRKTLVKRVTAEEQAQQLGGLGSPGGGEFVGKRDPAMFAVAGIQTLLGVMMIVTSKSKFFKKDPWHLAMIIGGAYLLANGVAELTIGSYLYTTEHYKKVTQLFEERGKES
jgi:hypothetical protein